MLSCIGTKSGCVLITGGSRYIRVLMNWAVDWKFRNRCSRALIACMCVYIYCYYLQANG
uniref:Uncharacterized protein n=1 Tax=Anguilla anguilla TaxID=7936 RepID=A0A0E9WC45_ANGAN